MHAGEMLPFIITVILTVIPTWRIVRRTGLNPALALLIIIPAMGPLVIMSVLAFKEWPVFEDVTER